MFSWDVAGSVSGMDAMCRSATGVRERSEEGHSAAMRRETPSMWGWGRKPRLINTAIDRCASNLMGHTTVSGRQGRGARGGGGGCEVNR